MSMQEDAAGDDSAYAEDRDWPAPADADDAKIRPNQGALFAAGVFRCALERRLPLYPTLIEHS